MENTTNQNANNQNQTTSIQLKINAVLGLENAEETSTLWVGRGAKNRRDLKLSQEIPSIKKETVIELANLMPEKITDFLNDSFEQYIKRVKCQRMEIGDSISLQLPADNTELALFALIALTEGTRTKKELTAATVREVINSDVFKKAATLHCASAGIKEDAFNRIVVAEFLRGCTVSDYTIYKTREVAQQKSAAHLDAIAALIDGQNPQAVNVLKLAAERIRNAQILSDEEAI